MRAFTLFQPYASLIVVGAKPIEWRHWLAPDWIIGERIVIHASAKQIAIQDVQFLLRRLRREAEQVALGEIVERPTSLIVDKAIALFDAWIAGKAELPLSAGIGTAVVERTASAEVLGFEPGTVGLDSDRLPKQNCGWVLSDVEQWAEPIPSRGFQRLWNWREPADVLPEVLG